MAGSAQLIVSTFIQLDQPTVLTCYVQVARQMTKRKHHDDITNALQQLEENCGQVPYYSCSNVAMYLL